MGAARELVGLEVLVPEEILQPLEKDTFYSFEIVGSSVFTTGRKLVGTVIDVLDIPGNELLVVDGSGGEVLIPLTKEICLEINPAAKEIVIEPPDGLLDLNEI